MQIDSKQKKNLLRIGSSLEANKRFFELLPIGPCVGYGLTAVTFCDFVIASETATFSYPEVRIGIPTIVGAIRLPKKLNWSDAMELLLIGKPVSANRAKEMGLVWKVCEPVYCCYDWFKYFLTAFETIYCWLFPKCSFEISCASF